MALSSSSDATPIYLPFSQRMSNGLDKVSIDHSYAKPWSTHPEASNAQPVRLLFMDPLPRQPNANKSKDESEMIDVEIQDKPVMPDYDISNARSIMSECERHAVLLRPDFAEMKDDWEEHIAAVRTTWSVLQNRIFAKVMRILQGDRLARLTIVETKNEPIQRRLQIDKAAKRVKFAFANVNWDMPLILWLHNLFLDNLRGQLLTSYLEILQTLKLKIPSLIEKLIEGTECKPGGLTMESLSILLKRTWDPVLSSINQQKPKKLPGQSLLLVISNVPSVANSPLATKRHKFWQHQLNFMGKVINIVPVNNSATISVANCVENMVASTRSKILEVKGHFPGRPIVLVGFHIGSLVACQVALMEHVQAVVCLGYPTMGIHGNRGEIDDPVYNYKTPILFVVGQHASSCSVDALEDIREKLRVDSGLIVVGGADDHLRMSRAKKKSCGITQSVVDRCVIDEVSNFLGNTLQSEVSSSDSMDDVDIVKKIPRKRKKQALAVAVGSQTSGDLVNQKSAKALKNLKQDPMLSSVGAGMPGIPSSSKQAIPKMTKTGKRPSPRKQSKSTDSEIPAKRPLMQVNLKSGSSKKSHGQSSLSTRNEAAVIASAPELSNLLQNMKSDLSRFPCSKPPLPSSAMPTIPVSTLPSSMVSSSIQTTTALTLSKFLLSSNIFKPGENTLNSSGISLDSKIDNTVCKNTTTSSHPTPMATDTIPKKQETQILIHTRDSPVPITFPVTFTMASKVLKTTAAPLMKVTSTGHPIPSFPFDNKSKVIQAQQVSGHSSSSALSSILQSVVSSSNIPTSSIIKDSTPASKSSVASVINIGNDTVQMKETLPSASAPGTVSIDLGQLSTSNNIVMKFGNPSKISLMPTLKPVSSSSLLSSDKIGPAVSGLLGQSKSTLASTSSAVSLISAVKTQPTTLPVYSSGKSNEKNLTILSSSDLLSSLSSNTGLITLKLSTPTSSSGITLTSQKLCEKSEGSEGVLKVLPEKPLGVTTMPKNVTAMTFNPSTVAMAVKGAKPSISQNLQKVKKEEPGEQKALPPGMSVIFATASKSNITSATPLSGHFTFQTANSNISFSSPSLSHKAILVNSSETLGKVTSLLESSPVTVDQPKTSSSFSDFSSTKDSNSDTAHKGGKPVASSTPSHGHTTSNRASKSTVASYTPTTKNVLPTVASTRTRTIKTPKQYDL